MASVYDFKPRFQGMLRPLVVGCVRRGITPNHLTLAGILGSVVVGSLLPLAGRFAAVLLLLPAWLLVRMALNAMDGMAAREHGLQSSFGAVLNELGDVLADLALYLPLAFLAPGLVWPVVIFCLGAVVTEFAGVLGQALGARRHYGGPMGKSDRALLVGLLGIGAFFAPAFLAWWPLVLWVASLLTVVTTANRLRGALGEIAGAARP